MMRLAGNPQSISPWQQAARLHFSLTLNSGCLPPESSAIREERRIELAPDRGHVNLLVGNDRGEVVRWTSDAFNIHVQMFLS